LVLYRFEVDSDEIPTTPWEGFALDGLSSSLTLPSPPASDLSEIEDLPGTLLGIYQPMLVQDEDGDQSHSEGEAFVGISPTLLIYLDGELDPALVLMGLGLGWWSMDALTGDIGPAELDLSLNLMDRGLDLVGGELEGDPAPDARVAMFSAIDELGEVDPVLDQALSSPWTIDLSAGPPEAHQYSGPDLLGAVLAMETVVAYQDLDRSGGPSDGDGILGTLCREGSAVSLMWGQAPDTFSAAWFMGVFGTRAGWQLVAVDPLTEGTTWLSDDEAMALQFGMDCWVEE